ERPGTFTNTFGEHRQPDARLHPISAVYRADAHRFHLRAGMISRIENANLPRAEVLSQWRRGMIGQPRQTLFAQLKQPVLRISILAEHIGGAAQRLIQAVVAVGEERGIGDFDWRLGSRSDRESVNNIEQDRATGGETGGDGGAKILYTSRRGTFLDWHTTSLPLEVPHGGALDLPLFVQTRASGRYLKSAALHSQCQ